MLEYSFLLHYTSNLFFRLFTRFILEAPALSDSIVDFVKRYCEDDVSFLFSEFLSNYMSSS